MSDVCQGNDWRTNALTFCLCLGIAASYIPQHVRIIVKKSSEGFSPWFLLLGSTAAASTMLNIIILQWNVIKCCNEVSPGTCIGLVGGVIQCAIVWVFFTLILVLYMIYYPPHLKYLTVDVPVSSEAPPAHIKTSVRTDEWRISVILAWVVLLHIAFTTFVTFFLLLSGTAHQQNIWAAFLGIFAAVSAAIQYTPQLQRTYETRLVGALSIPMMLIQTPGAVLMVISVVVRPGTNWTSWITFAVAGIMQGALLVMCLFWKVRQRKLGIDDFGNPLDADTAPAPTPEDRTAQSVHAAQDDSPVPITHGPPQGETLHEAVEEAVEEDVRSVRSAEHERTPLLRTVSRKDEGTKGWLAGWFGRG